MVVRPVVVDALLVVAVVVQAGSCLGVLVMRDAYSRLHYAAAATTVGPIAVAAAVVVEEALSEQGVKAVLTAAVLLTGGALLTHATGRAARVREHGRFAVLADEREKPR
jgi:multisubunit Na+/H+ antiporter MnhG subunit